MKTLPLVFVALALVTGCAKQEQAQPPQQTGQTSITQGKPEGPSNRAAGITWKVPSAWMEQPERQMRIATYMIPVAEGDGDGGECAVFYFGSGQGGDVESNINRWVSQFESASKPERSTREINGMTVHLVSVTGTYLAPAGPMMQSQGKKSDYHLQGAIVEAPEGMVFFKATGPAKTMHNAEADFNTLLGSIARM